MTSSRSTSDDPKDAKPATSIRQSSSPRNASSLRGFHTEIVIEPDPANGLEQSSAAQCQHVRAVSPARVVDTLGNVGPLALTRIRETIAVIIDLP